MITDPHPRNIPAAPTYRDLSEEMLEFYFREARRELRATIERFRPDIVECQHIWTTAYLMREFGLPYVAVAHHSDQMGFRYDQRIQPYALQAAHGAKWIFAISEYVRREVLTLYGGLPAARVVFLANGYDRRIFCPQLVDRDLLLGRLGIPASPELPLITFSGKLSRTKGVDILLRANRLIQRERKSLLLLAGAERLEDEFSPEEQADFHWENAFLLGQQPQAVLAGLHNLAAVSAMPSRTEGFGIAALEAMGCGAPVVATRSGGPETFIVGRTVEVGEVEGLAQALLDVINLPATTARKLRQLALHTAKRYSWDEIVKRRIAFFQQALGRDKRRR